VHRPIPAARMRGMPAHLRLAMSMLIGSVVAFLACYLLVTPFNHDALAGGRSVALALAGSLTGLVIELVRRHPPA
jgi:uncharacterized membrane protein YjfL (UPF0719 family)